MSTADEREASALMRATQHVGRIHARRMLRTMKKTALEKARLRKETHRKALALGFGVIAAGCGEWRPAQVTGALLDLRERVGDSTTMMLAFLKRGEAARQARAGKQRAPKPPPPESP